MDQSAVDIAKDAENLQDAGEPDSFPPEGTDEATLDPDAGHDLSEEDRLKATRDLLKGH
jgi:hypothetical protein